MQSLFDTLPEPETLRQRAETIRAGAESAADASETPRLTKSSQIGLAESLERLAAVIEATPEPETTGNAWADRKARRIARLRLRAEKMRAKSAEAWAQSTAMGSRIPFGQPILVGHHSEGRHRRLLKRMESIDRKSIELERLAKRYDSRADAAECDSSISSQDPEAAEKIRAKIATLEAQNESRKRVNLAYRRFKKNPASLESSDLAEEERAIVRQWKPEYSFERAPYRPYEMQNCTAEIRRLKDRLEKLDALAKFKARPDRMMGDVRIVDNMEFQKIELHFPDKPTEGVRTMLKRYGFRWVRSAGCWSRSLSGETEGRIKLLAQFIGASIVPA